MGKKILKLKFKGSDFGYVRMVKGSDTFYGGGSEKEAIEFELIAYKGSSKRFYYKVAGTKDSYMDFSLSSSVVKITKPFLSVESSTICAWELIDNELHAILADKDTTKAISRSAADPESKALYANSFVDVNHCEVSIENSTGKSSNSEKPELQHELV
ncbi:hypothetical protein [Chromobacterium haemolyticum]|uniref:Uncharacterized protein n=1 Tax=Chromobacterium haemolyticum TaxID=394935 RepID=A0A1W0CHF0_9NEIS|nr:hypothetical protein [Chromobacterium haemolyticum]OQS34155.1 hypothetical protein B0T45_19285 [Chromobacterium haemolyticum]